MACRVGASQLRPRCDRWVLGPGLEGAGQPVLPLTASLEPHLWGVRGAPRGHRPPRLRHTSGRGLGPLRLGLCSGPMLIFYLFESGTGSGFKVT